MKTIRLCLLLCVATLPWFAHLNAATVTGTLKTAGGVALSTNIIYVPLSTPIGGTGIVYEGTPITNKSGVNGAFSLTLGPGKYRVWIATLPTAYSYITLPDDSNSYELSQLLTNGLAITNAFVATTPASRSFLLLTNTAAMLTYLGVAGGSATNAPSLAENFLIHGGTNDGKLTAFLLLSAGTNTSLRTNGTRLNVDTTGYLNHWSQYPTSIIVGATDWASYSTNALTTKLESNVWQTSWGALGTNAITVKLASNEYLGQWSLYPTSIVSAASDWASYSTNALSGKLGSNAALGAVWAGLALTNANGTNTIYVSPDGSDTADGLRFDRAKLTLSNALWTCRNGDRVVMLPGDYTNSLSRHRANDATGLAPINLVQKTNVTLLAHGAIIGCDTNTISLILISNCHNIVIDGLSTYMSRAGLIPPAVSNAWNLAANVFGVVELVNSTAVTIRNCRLDGGWDHLILFDPPGSLVSETNSCAVLNNYLANCGQNFAGWYDGAAAVVSGGAVVSGNTIWRTGNGIEVYPLPEFGVRQPGPSIVGNVIQGTVNPGISVERCLGGTVSGNIIVRTTETQDAAGNVGIFLKDVTALAVTGNSIRDYINGIMFEGGVSNCTFTGNNIWGGTYGILGKTDAHKVAGCSFLGNTVSHTHNAGVGFQWSYRNDFSFNSFFDAATNVAGGHGVFRFAGVITTNRFGLNRFFASDYTGVAGVQMLGGSAGNEVFQNQFIGTWTAQYTDTVTGGTVDLGQTNETFNASMLTAHSAFYLPGTFSESYPPVAGYVWTCLDAGTGLGYWQPAPGGGTGGDMYFSKFNTTQFNTNGSIAAIKTGVVLTNAVNYGTSLSSFGTGPGSQAFGTNAVSSGTNSLALGRDATASGYRSVSVGFEAVASGEESAALGYSADALGFGAIAIGSGAHADEWKSIALGGGSESVHENSVVIGSSVSSLRTNEIRIGKFQDVYIGGKLTCETVVTNAKAPVVSEATGARVAIFSSGKELTNATITTTVLEDTFGSGIVTNGTLLTQSNALRVVTVTNSIWVPAGAWTPASNAPATGLITNSNWSVTDVYDFDDTAVETISATYVPGQTFAGNLKLVLHWRTAHPFDQKTNIWWEVAVNPIANGEAFGAFTYKTNYTTPNAWSYTSNTVLQSSVPLINITNLTSAALLDIRLSRTNTAGATNLLGDARFIGAWIQTTHTNYMGGMQ